MIITFLSAVASSSGADLHQQEELGDKYRRIGAGPPGLSDVTGVPGRPHIRRRFGMNMESAGQSGHLGVWGGYWGEGGSGCRCSKELCGR